MEKVYTLKEIREMRETSINAGLKAIKTAVVLGREYTAHELAIMSGGIFTDKGLEQSAEMHCRYSEPLYSSQKWRPDTRIYLTKGKRVEKVRRFAELDDKGNMVRTWEETTYEQSYNVRNAY